MKRFALILIVAVLALGCVFADTAVVTSKDANNNDKVIVYTKVKVVYPVYEIVATEGQSSTVEAVSSETGNTIEAKTSTTDENKVSIKITLNHFGVSSNDMNQLADGGKGKTDIRYNGFVHVSVEATKLNLVIDGRYSAPVISDTTNHVTESKVPSKSDDKYNLTTLENFTSKKDPDVADSVNTLNVLATYEKGLKVLTGAESKSIASCVFTWDTSILTAGDTYEADVVVTYTAV